MEFKIWRGPESDYEGNRPMRKHRALLSASSVAAGALQMTFRMSHGPGFSFFAGIIDLSELLDLATKPNPSPMPVGDPMHLVSSEVLEAVVQRCRDELERRTVTKGMVGPVHARAATRP